MGYAPMEIGNMDMSVDDTMDMNDMELGNM